MNHLHRFSVVLSIALALTGCSHDKLGQSVPTKAQTSKSNPVVNKEAEKAKDQAALQDRADLSAIDVESYSLKGHFNAASGILNARVDIALETLEPIEVVSLDSKGNEILRVQYLKDSLGTPLTFALDNDKLLITLPSIVQNITHQKINLRIEYRTKADKTRSLKYVKTRHGDPVNVPVLYTASEPRNASMWMPSNDRPNDRAKITMQFSMKPDERLIANGTLIEDQLSNEIRTMAYQTQYEIPTYVMAFAMGKFESKSKVVNGKDISLWWRRGLPVDAESLIHATEMQIQHFEKLLIPYPYEKYAVVLLPDFGGGMENVSITFNDEERSSQALNAGDYSLMAHELAHQWFGDYVTVEHWDDVWIKEGMATFLASEAFRSFYDERNSGRYFGDTFDFNPSDAIRDPSLKPEDKYTSGPYPRAAWLITQLRAMTGEETFWATLRDILETHAFGTVSTESFLAAFQPHLGDEMISRVRRALAAKTVATLKLTPSSVEPEARVDANLFDPDGSTLLPLTFQTLQLTDGAPTVISEINLNNGAPAESIRAPANGQILAFDSKDIHAPLFMFTEESEYELFKNTIETWLTPTATARPIFEHVPPTVQSQMLRTREHHRWSDVSALEAEQMWKMASAAYVRTQVLHLVCQKTASGIERISNSTDFAVVQKFAEQWSWASLLQQILAKPDYIGLDWGETFSECNGMADETYKSELEALRKPDTRRSLSEIRVEYLSRFNLELNNIAKTWFPVALEGESARMRLIAITALAALTAGRASEIAKLPVAEVEYWKKAARATLESTRLRRTMAPLLALVETLNDKGARPQLAEVIKDQNLRGDIRRNATCVAYRLEPATFSEFLKAIVGDIPDAPTEVTKAIQNAETECK